MAMIFGMIILKFLSKRIWRQSRVVMTRKKVCCWHSKLDCEVTKLIYRGGEQNWVIGQSSSPDLLWSRVNTGQEMCWAQFVGDMGLPWSHHSQPDPAGDHRRCQHLGQESLVLLWSKLYRGSERSNEKQQRTCCRRSNCLGSNAARGESKIISFIVFSKYFWFVPSVPRENQLSCTIIPSFSPISIIMSPLWKLEWALKVSRVH